PVLAGTASAGSDYTAPSAKARVGAGDRRETVTLATLADTVIEGSETVIATISAPSNGGVIGTPASATDTILDGTAAPVYTISGEIGRAACRASSLTAARAATGTDETGELAGDDTGTAGSDYA